MVEYGHLLKQWLRDLQPLNESAARVLQMVDKAIFTEVEPQELSVNEERLLVDIVHLVVGLLRTFSDGKHPEVVKALEGRLNRLAAAHLPCL